MDEVKSQAGPGDVGRGREDERVDSAGGFLADAELTRRLSPEELGQLEARARARLTDPDYQRRLRRMDRLAESVLEDGQR